VGAFHRSNNNGRRTVSSFASFRQSYGDKEIAQLKRQLAALEKKLDKLHKETDTRSGFRVALVPPILDLSANMRIIRAPEGL
jgi:hypothetical protein